LKTDRETDQLFSRFCVERLVFGETLVVPLMVVYREFKKILGDAKISPKEVADYLTGCGVVLKVRGKGKLKTVALGVGVKSQREAKPRVSR
jgi:hypothetical protein